MSISLNKACLVLQRNHCARRHKLILILSQANHGDTVLTDAINTAELIAEWKLSQCSGELDDAVFARWSVARLVGGSQAPGLGKVQLRVCILQCRYERGRDGGCTGLQMRLIETNSLWWSNQNVIGERGDFGIVLSRWRILILVP